MEEAAHDSSPFAGPAKNLARRMMTIGDNRLELLMVEVQEERDRLLHALLLVLGVALFTFLGGAALTVALVVLLWSLSPVGVLFTLTALYTTVAILLYRRFMLLLRKWQSFPATLDQLRKDRECLEKCLA